MEQRELVMNIKRFFLNKVQTSVYDWKCRSMLQTCLKEEETYFFLFHRIQTYLNKKIRYRPSVTG